MWLVLEEENLLFDLYLNSHFETSNNNLCYLQLETEWDLKDYHLDQHKDEATP